VLFFNWLIKSQGISEINIKFANHIAIAIKRGYYVFVKISANNIE